jgi:hypothetical protein
VHGVLESREMLVRGEGKGGFDADLDHLVDNEQGGHILAQV